VLDRLDRSLQNQGLYDLSPVEVRLEAQKPRHDRYGGDHSRVHRQKEQHALHRTSPLRTFRVIGFPLGWRMMPG